MIVTILKELFSDLLIASGAVVTGPVVSLLFGSGKWSTNTIDLSLMDCTIAKAVSDQIRSMLSDRIIDEAMTNSGPIFVIKGNLTGEPLSIRLDTQTAVSDTKIKNFLGIIMRVAV
ncbi:MAG: hypothetical protein PHD11_05430 [Bacteroidales bacterium]|nr:hypothetical protein [Bacteroidales bacterium]MDD4669967.1 hypothetical protein [Bacteroidales bacterium]